MNGVRARIASLHRLAAEERKVTAQLIAVLAEVDARRLYLAEGCSSLFTYCTQVLRLSEHAAYGRIEAARAVRKYPAVLERLSAGEITLTAVGLLAPHITDENHRHLLEAARHKTKRDVEHLVATLRLLLDWLLRSKAAVTDRPRAGRAPAGRSRHVPAAIRRAVWVRDDGRCTFIGAQGRCTERAFLEFHHIVPYAAGGDATVETIALRCRAHNQHEARLEFPLDEPVSVRESA